MADTVKASAGLLSPDSDLEEIRAWLELPGEPHQDSLKFLHALAIRLLHEVDERDAALLTALEPPTGLTTMDDFTRWGGAITPRSVDVADLTAPFVDHVSEEDRIANERLEIVDRLTGNNRELEARLEILNARLEALAPTVTMGMIESLESTIGALERLRESVRSSYELLRETE